MTATETTIASTIREQIGTGALLNLGARSFLALPAGLQFTIGANGARKGDHHPRRR